MPGNLPYPFDVSADGQRFVIMRPLEEDLRSPSPITVVTNWFEDFRIDGR